MKRIKVMIVDDSAVVRQVMTSLFAADPAFEPPEIASDPVQAMARMSASWPDVLVLDIEMPRMDGITFLRKIMQERPTPVVICSTLAQQGAATAMEALAAGAVAIVTKPHLGLRQFLEDSSNDLISTVKAAARARMPTLVATMKHSADAVLPPPTGRAMTETTERIVAIGTSTGGTQALESILTVLPRVCPGIVIVQHMPEKFTAEFAGRLDRLSQVNVREARHGDRVMPGQALIAPGGRHMLLRRSGAQYFVDVIDGPLVSRHRPSVDVLFRSVARHAGPNALGIIMTGMGDDGAAGLLEMRTAGAATLAQDEQSCVVYGMPKEAVQRGAVQRIVPLAAIPREILQWVPAGHPALPAAP